MEVIRDKDRVKHGECLDTFMRHVAASDFLCVFLSESYPKSPNCMYELLLAWQKHCPEPEKYSRHVKVWVMPGAGEIREIESRLEYVRYWKAKEAQIAPLMKEFADGGLSSQTLEEYRRIQKFAHAVDEILAYAAKRLSPSQGDEFSHWVKTLLQVDQTLVLDSLFGKVVSEMEALVSFNRALREFLLPRTADLIQQKPDGWRLNAKYTQSSFDLCIFLKAISDDLARFSGDAQGRAALGDFTGGLLMLGLDRAWVQDQRLNFVDKPLQVPAFSHELVTGAERRPVNILHVAVQAIAGGRVRLDKLFGIMEEDPLLVKEDLPLVLRGNQVVDKAHEARYHLIQHILHPKEAIDKANRDLVREMFLDVQSAVYAAFYDDLNPIFTNGQNFHHLSGLVRKELELSELILLQPTGADSSKRMLSQHIRVFRFLSKIFDFVQGR